MTDEIRSYRAIKRTKRALYYSQQLCKGSRGTKYKLAIHHLKRALNELVDLHEETFEENKL